MVGDHKLISAAVTSSVTLKAFAPICLLPPAVNSKRCHPKFLLVLSPKVFTNSCQQPQDVSKAASASCHWSRWLCWVPLCHWVPQCWIQVFLKKTSIEYNTNHYPLRRVSLVFSHSTIEYWQQSIEPLFQGGCHRQLFQFNKRWSFLCCHCNNENGLRWIRMEWDWFDLTKMDKYGLRWIWWLIWIRHRWDASVFGKSATVDGEDCHLFGGWFEVVLTDVMFIVQNFLSFETSWQASKLRFFKTTTHRLSHRDDG